MQTKPTKGQFTGRHMLMAMVGGFSVVIAVNFYMASLATSGFGGVIVKNTYVASQKFNGWLDEAERQRELGWEAQPQRADDGHLVVETLGVPELSTASAMIRRPLGELDASELELVRQTDGRFRSVEPIAEGRWIVRLEITSAGQSWRQEQQIR